MRTRRNFLMVIGFSLYFSISYANLGLLPISLKNAVYFPKDTPSATIIVKDVENQRVEPFYFVLYEGSNQTMSFFGNHYQILSSQFQSKGRVINNFCGLVGREVTDQSLAIALTFNSTSQQFNCQLTVDSFS